MQESHRNRGVDAVCVMQYVDALTTLVLIFECFISNRTIIQCTDIIAQHTPKTFNMCHVAVSISLSISTIIIIVLFL